jgi:hypothetical protein
MMSPRSRPQLDELPPLPEEIPEEEEPETEPDNPIPIQRNGRRKRRVHRAAASSTSSSVEAGRKGQQLKQIGQELDQAFTLIGAAISPLVPVTGAVLVARGPMGSDIVCKIARKDDRVLAALLAISRYAVWGELAMFVGTIGIAVTIDLGQQSPNSMIARRLIGDELLQTVYAERSNGSSPTPPAPQQSVPAGWPNSNTVS